VEWLKTAHTPGFRLSTYDAIFDVYGDFFAAPCVDRSSSGTSETELEYIDIDIDLHSWW
jgi:hypothetical protein